MPSSSWRSIDPKAVPIHFKSHQETISISCSPIKIHPMPIQRPLSIHLLPVTRKLCEGMSVFRWSRKLQCISRSSGEVAVLRYHYVLNINKHVLIQHVYREKRGAPCNTRTASVPESLSIIKWHLNCYCLSRHTRQSISWCNTFMG